MWSSSGLGMEGSNVQVLVHEREWGLGEEIDHLLILANLAGEHCLSVRRDGQMIGFQLQLDSWHSSALFSLDLE